MKFRKTAIALATVASLVVIPTTVAYAGGSDKDCQDGKRWNDYKYAPPKECEKEHKDRDHRDKDRDKKEYSAPKQERQTTYTGRVLKTD